MAKVMAMACMGIVEVFLSMARLLPATDYSLQVHALAVLQILLNMRCSKA